MVDNFRVGIIKAVKRDGQGLLRSENAAGVTSGGVTEIGDGEVLVTGSAGGVEVRSDRRLLVGMPGGMGQPDHCLGGRGRARWGGWRRWGRRKRAEPRWQRWTKSRWQAPELARGEGT